MFRELVYRALDALGFLTKGSRLFLLYQIYRNYPNVFDLLIEKALDNIITLQKVHHLQETVLTFWKIGYEILCVKQQQSRPISADCDVGVYSLKMAPFRFRGHSPLNLNLRLDIVLLVRYEFARSLEKRGMVYPRSTWEQTDTP